MDEILFECAFTLDEKHMEELSRKVLGIRRIIFLTVYLIVAVLWLAMVLFDLWFWGFSSWSSWLYLTVSAGFTLYYLFLPKINAKRSVRRIRKYYDGTIPEDHLFFTEKEIISKDDNGEVRFHYDKFDKAMVTEHLLILTAQKYLRLTLRKDSFTKGTYEEFLTFLRTRCPSLKIPE